MYSLVIQIDVVVAGTLSVPTEVAKVHLTILVSARVHIDRLIKLLGDALIFQWRLGLHIDATVVEAEITTELNDEWGWLRSILRLLPANYSRARVL